MSTADATPGAVPVAASGASATCSESAPKLPALPPKGWVKGGYRRCGFGGLNGPPCEGTGDFSEGIAVQEYELPMERILVELEVQEGRADAYLRCGDAFVYCSAFPGAPCRVTGTAGSVQVGGETRRQYWIGAPAGSARGLHWKVWSAPK